VLGTSDPGDPALPTIPPTGFGWDRTHAYLGIPYQNASQSNTASKAFGLNLTGIDYQAVANAVIADVNRHGGLFGRNVTPVFAEFPPVAQTGQAQCATWTQDNHVYAVVDSFIPEDTLSGCLAKAKVPFSNGSYNAIDQKVLNHYRPYFRKLTTVSNDTLFPTFLDRLKAQGYFRGWNTSTGGPGSAPVKAGLICRDDYEANRDGCADLARLLKARGYAVGDAFHVSGATAPASDAVLKMTSQGVTHVFSQTTDILFFMQAAEQQRYRPRYALTTTNVPGLLAGSGGAPAAQLAGSLGVGSAPLVDVATPPAMGPGRAHCKKVLKDAHVDVDPGYLAQAAAQGLCDEIYLYVDAARAGGGFTPSHLTSGFARISATFQAGTVFRVGFTATRFDEPSAVRDLGYDAECHCFRFLSATNWPS
jgi:hypothetical protein